jgi:hypothetical protein
MANLYTQTLQAQFVKLKESFVGIFNTNPTDTVQGAFEVLDEILVPLLDTDREYGLYPIEDKELLLSLQGTIEDIQFLLSDFDMYITDVQEQQNINFQNLETTFKENIDTFKTEVQTSIQQTVDNALASINVKLTSFETVINTIDQRLVEVEVCCANNEPVSDHILTSSFASFTYESTEPLLEHIIQHNLNSYTLMGDPLMMNADGMWERDLANLTVLDENTVKVSLIEPGHVMLTMTAVEYFVSHIYEGYGDVFDIEHKLGSFNLVWSIYMKDNDVWVNDLGKVVFIDSNNVRVTLTEPQYIRICLMRLS